MALKYTSSDKLTKYHVCADMEGNTLVFSCDPVSGVPAELEGTFDNLMDARAFIEHNQEKEYNLLYT